MEILEGKPVADKIKEDLKSKLITLNLACRTGRSKLKLAIILVGNDPASVIYTAKKRKFGKEIGVGVEIIKFGKGVSEKTLQSKLSTLNFDTGVGGIIIQLPLPKHLNTQSILDLVDPSKDVDGLTWKSQNSDYPEFYPAGALAVEEILNHYSIEIVKRKIAIVGQSDLVGKPLAKLLKNADAKVTTADIDTPDLKSITDSADILISAVGKPGLITGDLVRNGVVLIDVGTTLVGKKLKGDIDDSALAKAAAATPVPGGVGPVTVACLFKNLLKTSSFFQKLDK